MTDASEPAKTSVATRLLEFVIGLVGMPAFMALASLLPEGADQSVMLNALPAVALVLVFPSRTRWFALGALVAFVGAAGWMWMEAARE